MYSRVLDLPEISATSYQKSMACDSGNDRLLKEGYLLKSPDALKYITVLKKWQKKLFRLMDNGDLYYFDSDKSARPTGIIHMPDCRRIFDPKSRGIQFNYCIGLEVDDSAHYIKAENAAMYNSWIEVMAAFAEKNEAPMATISSSPSPSVHRRYSGLPAEGRGHQGEIGESRTLSVSAKVRSKSADKSGWLYKTGPNNKGWNHRFFVLSNGQLSYYRTEKAEKSLGTIDLKECTGVNQVTVKKGYGLTIEVPSRTYHIAADTEADQREWIVALNIAISLLVDSKLSAGAAESLVRSGSGSSGSSDLFSSSTTESHPIAPPATTTTDTRDTLVLSLEEGAGGGGSGGGEGDGESEKKQEKDSVVQLLEAEVDALRGQVSNLREELQTSGSVRAQLQTQLEEVGRQREREVHSITVDRDNLQAKLVELESTKQSLESVNDSLRLQLDEVREASMEAEELRVQGELEETQVALAAAEDEVKSYQQELNDTQDLLQEIRSVAMDLQTELIRRGDFVPDTFHKMRSLSTTASELLASPGPTSSLSLSLHTQLECEERPATVVGYIGEGERNTLSPMEEEEKLEEEGGRGDGEEGGRDRGGSLLAEERLKWQMEMENMRKEYEVKEEEEKEKREEEVKQLKERVGELEELCQDMRREVEEGKEKDRELQQLKERVSELEGELRGAKERVSQLQVEKEKALADLRKLNRTVVRKSSKVDSEPPSPTVSDSRVEELSKQLNIVQKERDELKRELEELKASMTNGPPSSGGTGNGSPFFLRKSRATVAASRYSYAAPTPPSPLTNGQHEDVPVKPQRPSKAVITNKLAEANQSSPPTTRARSRTTTFFHNLLHNNS